MKNKHSQIVYSTDPNYKAEEVTAQKAIHEKSHILKLFLDRKQRAGKLVTVIEGFRESIEEIEALAKELKSKCATGGTVKDRTIEIQGDFRERIEKMLIERGFKVKRSGG